MSEAVTVQKKPYLVDLEEGQKYAWCACGRSGKQPFCDGSHKVTSMTPIVSVAEKTETVRLCGCKQTGGPPFCDGTHKQL